MCAKSPNWKYTLCTADTFTQPLLFDLGTCDILTVAFSCRGQLRRCVYETGTWDHLIGPLPNGTAVKRPGQQLSRLHFRTAWCVGLFISSFTRSHSSDSTTHSNQDSSSRLHSSPAAYQCHRTLDTHSSFRASVTTQTSGAPRCDFGVYQDFPFPHVYL